MRLVEEADLDPATGTVKRLLYRVETDETPPRFAYVEEPLFRKMLDLQRAGSEVTAQALLNNWQIRYANFRDNAIQSFDERRQEASTGDHDTFFRNLRLQALTEETTAPKSKRRFPWFWRK
ncbi:MAG: hypothetical protein HY329_21495 [Chloroflexi bacterium]|nr:hypothetical protein [Chloroflexota bacterium]